MVFALYSTGVPAHHEFTRPISYLKTIIALSRYEKYNISSLSWVYQTDIISQDNPSHFWRQIFVYQTSQGTNKIS